MSAIIAGEKCKGCGEKYWLSFGSPDWWKDVVMKGMTPCPIYLMYNEMRRSGLCSRCWCFKKVEEDISTLSDEHLGFLAFIFALEDLL